MANKGLHIGLLLLIGACVIHFTMGNYASPVDGFGLDDAYISFRYARNLAHGDGLVFNPGERVEGYTNFLYIVLMAPVFFITDGLGVYYFSAFLNVLCTIAAFLLFYSYVQQKYGEQDTLPACLLFALTPALWSAVGSGMETPLVILVQMAIWIEADRVGEDPSPRHIYRLAGLVILSILVRADGFVIPLVVIVYLFMKGYWRTGGVLLACLLVSVTIYIAWRYSYYGYPFPNTYYAKVSGPLGDRLQHGLKQWIGVTLFDGLLPGFVVTTGILLMIVKRLRNGRQAVIRLIPLELALSAGLTMYWIFVGGDIFAERFLIILFPLGISLFLMLIRRLEGSRKVRATMAFVALYLICQGVFFGTDPRFTYRLQKYDSFLTLGDFLASHYKDAVLAVDAAGKIPYFTGLKTIDMLGLNDLYIGHKETDFFLVGHNKFDPDYVLNRHPDLIASPIDTKLNMNWGLDRLTYESSGYHLRYLLNTFPGRTDNIVDVNGFAQEKVVALIKQGYDYAVLDKSHD